jgi:hypothetical protein
MSACLSRSVLIMVFACLAGCSSKLLDDYRYRGEKYGKISVSMTAPATSDRAKASIVGAVGSAVTAQLKQNNLYDERSNNTIDVVVTSLKERDVLSAALGASQRMEGTATLKTPDGRALRKFTVDTSRAPKTPPDGRYSRTLYDTFAELTANAILGRK